MKFAILGAGAVGGYFGARLRQAGEDVVFLARGKHLKEIRDNGLKVESENGDVCLQNCLATDNATDIGAVDYVFFAVKLYQTIEAAEFARPMVGPDTTIIALQNGVECADALAKIHGKERVLNGTCFISAVILQPGLIQQTGKFASLAFGEFDGTISNRCKKLKEACDRAGLNPEISDNIEKLVWMKFIRIATLAGITTSTRQPIGELRKDPEIRSVIRTSFEESVTVARAKGIDLPEQIVAQELRQVDAFPPQMVASMLNDLKYRKQLELDWITGAVCRFGQEIGVPTPTHDTFYAVLKPYKNGA